MQIGNRIIFWQDIFVVLAFALYLGTGFLTSFILADIGQYTQYANQLESDPLARIVFQMNGSILMVQMVTIAFTGALYYIMRRNFIKLKNESTYMAFSFYSILVMLLMLLNFINDLPIFLKLAMGG